MQLSIKLDLQKISKISFKNRLLVNNHDCHIYCQNIQNLLLIVFYSPSHQSMVGIIMCVYGSLIIPIPLFIQHLNICIKVFKAKCGDKVYMWVLVFFWKMCVSNTNAAAHARAY